MASLVSSLVRAPRTQVARVKRALSAERIAYLRSRRVQPDHVLYESFAGNGMLCNPEAIFRALLDDPDFSNLIHFWAIDDSEAAEAFRGEFAGHPRVRMVVRETHEYHRAVATAGWLVNNATFGPQFGKRPGQTYLNTWHGTPLKHMGFDMPDGAYQANNTLRNFLNADYLLAANPFMAEVMYEQAYRLTNIFAGEIIEEGYPRIDHQWLTDADRDALVATLRRAGIDVHGTRVVVYAPTWRGTNFSAPKKDIDDLAARVAELQDSLRAELGEDVIVLLKTHQSVHTGARTHPTPPKNLVPNTIPTNALLGLADALVTDYSSIFFDFLATGRPIAFCAPDAEAYAEDRGTYFPLDELPGPVQDTAAATGADLAALMREGATPHPQYASWKERFTPFDDGSATQRVIDIVFRGLRDGRRVRPAATDGRIPIMLYLGGMKSNGITTSAVNLLHSIDYDKYDVTTLTARHRNKEKRANQGLIDPRARQIMRLGQMNGSKALQALRHFDNYMLRSRKPREARWHSTLWHDEWTRLMGGAKFQWVADYSGYGAFWANLLLYAPARRRSVWLHNEMAKDREREVNGRKAHFRNLSLMFGLYPSFDTLVSVSPSLARQNRVDLADYAAPEKFLTVRNLPNVPRVEEGKAVPLVEAVQRPARSARWLEPLSNPASGLTWFVTVGRLSPEKNQERALRAFARVHAERPDTRLLIIGDGPLRRDLQRIISELGLQDAAFLTGPQNNPFAIMAACDCFVLSSRYEGQPMVLLEAALCELPTVSTRFASVEDALPGDIIRIVEQSDDALADGMRAYLAGEVAPATLDIPAYTADVLAELDQVISTSTPTVPVRIPRSVR